MSEALRTREFQGTVITTPERAAAMNAVAQELGNIGIRVLQGPGEQYFPRTATESRGNVQPITLGEDQVRVSVGGLFPEGDTSAFYQQVDTRVEEARRVVEAAQSQGQTPEQPTA